MKNRIDMSYFGYGNRDFECFQQPTKMISPWACVKSSASNILQRNYLDFDPGVVQNIYSPNNLNNENKNKKNNLNRSSSDSRIDADPLIYNKYHPEYKIYRNTNEQIKELNNYLSPVGQYLYKDNPKIKTVEKLFSIQKSRKNMMAGEEENKKYSSRNMSNRNSHYSKSYQNTSFNNSQKIILKNPVDTNILIPNNFRLKNINSLPEINYGKKKEYSMNIDNPKYCSFLESKEAPEYLRNYDKESLKNIDQYYINKNENVHILSRFGDWITLRPNDKNRSHALEKIKHGTNETSIIAPAWMDIKSRRDKKFDNYSLEKNIFKCVQHNNTFKDNTKVTMLMDRDQKNAKPLFLRDSREKNAILLNQYK